MFEDLNLDFLKEMDLPLSFFSEDLIDVIVVRGGQRDKWNNLQPGERIPVKGCLLAGRTSAEKDREPDISGNQMTIYHKTFVFRSSDLVEIPKGARMEGSWAVLGRTIEWSEGNEALLQRSDYHAPKGTP